MYTHFFPDHHQPINKISIFLNFYRAWIGIASYIKLTTQLCRKITEMSLRLKPCPVFERTLARVDVLFRPINFMMKETVRHLQQGIVFVSPH